jgi:hypothetical protein
MRSACCRQGSPRRFSSGGGPLSDTTLLHRRDLRQDRDDQLADTGPDWPKTIDVHGDAKFQESSDGRLNVDGVAPKAINGIDTDAIASADDLEQLCETRPISGQDSATHSCVDELSVKPATQGDPLSFDALVSRRHSIVRDPDGWLIS